MTDSPKIAKVKHLILLKERQLLLMRRLHLALAIEERREGGTFLSVRDLDFVRRELRECWDAIRKEAEDTETMARGSLAEAHRELEG